VMPTRHRNTIISRPTPTQMTRPNVIASTITRSSPELWITHHGQQPHTLRALSAVSWLSSWAPDTTNDNP